MDINLFNGEKLTLKKKLKEKIVETDKTINAKYERGITRIVTEQARFHIETISGMVDSSSYKLNPEYQRRHRWDVERKSALIESLLMNVPIPPIFLYEYEFSQYEVMDGLQRLSSIASFYKDEYALSGLLEWPELNGMKYSDLPEKIRAGIDRRYISAIILLKETAKNSFEADRLKQMVFDRINSGGEKLDPQETRNANFGGSLNRLCIELSANKSLCHLWGIPTSDDDARAENPLFKKMGDVELVLRFFAYRQRAQLQKKSLKDYLDFYLKEGNAFNPEVLKNLKKLFIETIEFAEELFGERAFYIYRMKGKKSNGIWDWFEQPSIAVYDSMMLVLSQNLHNRKKLLQNKKRISGGLEELYKNNAKVFEGRSTNPTDLTKRDLAISEFMKQFV